MLRVTLNMANNELEDALQLLFREGNSKEVRTAIEMLINFQKHNSKSRGAKVQESKSQ